MKKLKHKLFFINGVISSYSLDSFEVKHKESKFEGISKYLKGRG
jgi:hypothetical protein